MSEMKIVKFENGKYGIRKLTLSGNIVFYSRHHHGYSFKSVNKKSSFYFLFFAKFRLKMIRAENKERSDEGSEI